MSGYRSNLDITGNVYGRLTVLGYDHSAKHKSYWRCRCECGKETIVNRYSLTSGKTRSCGCLRSDSVRMVRGGFHKLDVSERTKNWIRKHYKHTKNAEIMERFGLSDGWLHRFARAEGLKKTPQFLRKVQLEASAHAKQSHLRNGTFPPKGYVIPGREKNGFKKGETTLDRIGAKREAERIQKSAESRRKTWKLEHARMLFGLPRETKLAVVKHPREHALRRHRLKRLGYICERGSYDVYYDFTTRRDEALEASSWPFRFHPLEEGQS